MKNENAIFPWNGSSFAKQIWTCCCDIAEKIPLFCQFSLDGLAKLNDDNIKLQILTRNHYLQILTRNYWLQKLKIMSMKSPNSFDWIVGMRDRLLPKIKDYTSLQPDFPPEDEKDRLEWNLQISITWQFGLQNIWLHHTLQAFRRYDTFEVFTKTCFTQFGGRCLRNCVSGNIVSHAGR